MAIASNSIGCDGTKVFLAIHGDDFFGARAPTQTSTGILFQVQKGIFK